MLHKKFGILYLTRTSSNKYEYAKLSKCNTKYSSGDKYWNFYWSMIMFRIGSGKILELKNILEFYV